MKKRLQVVMTLVLFMCSLFVFVIPANAAPSTPVLKNDPIDGQILPYYDVWLRWYDTSNEAYYTMTIRDLTTGQLIPTRSVSQNSTYYIVYKSELIPGHQYRWCLNAYDSSGNRAPSYAPTFTIEPHNTDVHIFSNGYASAKNLEYFVYAQTTAYDSILNSAVQSWNGISSNVSLTRTGTPTDGAYELGIYESPTPTGSTLLGYTNMKIGGMNGTSIVGDEAFDYAEIYTYKENIEYYFSAYNNWFIISSLNDYLKANAMHEVGHALGLKHTSCMSSDCTYTICHSTADGSTIPLVMNSSYETGGPSLNVVDRDHLRIKWGA